MPWADDHLCGIDHYFIRVVRPQRSEHPREILPTMRNDVACHTRMATFDRCSGSLKVTFSCSDRGVERMPTRLGTVLSHRSAQCRRVDRLIPSVRVGLAALVAFVTLIVDVDTADAHSPHDDVGDIAVSPAYAEDRTVFAIVRGRLMRSTDGGRTWVELVHGARGETRVLAHVAVAPSDEQVMYLTTLGDGVLRSEDGGMSWH